MQKRNFTKGLAVMLAATSVAGVVPMTGQADEELKTIKILGVDNSATDDSGNTVYLSDWVNGDSKMWERLTSDLAERGIALELDLVPVDQYPTVIQTQLAAGLDCDMVYIKDVDTKTRNNLCKRGTFVPVNEIWENYSDGTAKKYFEEGNGTVIKKLNTMEDGNVYWLSPITVGDYNGDVWGGFLDPMIRKDWLDKLGLEMPTTTDELLEVLKAFQEQDANENGQADEVVAISYDEFGNGLSQYFGLGTDIVYIDYETGEVSSPWYQDGIKDYIAFMQKLVENNLLEVSGQGDEKKAENKVAMVKQWWISTWDEPGITVGEGQAAPYYVGLICQGREDIDPLVIRQDGVQKGGYDYAVTSNADPEAIGALLDYLYGDEYGTLSEYGIEGYTYDVNEEGKLVKKTETGGISEVEIMSKLPALWVNGSILPRVETTDRAQELISCADAGKTMGYPDNGFEAKADAIRNIYENPDAYHYAVMDNEAAVALATDEEIERTAEIKTDLDTYYKELLTKLILGQQSMDDWDTYIEEMKSLGLDELISIIQARYDRTNQ